MNSAQDDEGSKPGEVRSSAQLGPLPEPEVTALSDYFLSDGSQQSLAFTHDQMRAHARAAVAAERERIINALPGGHSVDPQWVADMVRNGA